jgi:hypothetical protein
VQDAAFVADGNSAARSINRIGPSDPDSQRRSSMP